MEWLSEVWAGDAGLLVQVALFLLVGCLLFQVIGFLSMFLFYRRTSPPLDTSKPLPGVSILKPCAGARDNEEENFDVFFRQDYPGKLQILFSVSSEDDGSVPVIKKFLEKYPNVDAELVISRTRVACHRKVDALYDAHQRAKHEIVVWSDADSIVGTDYISQMVAGFDHPRIGVVTTPQIDTRFDGWPTALKGLANNVDVATFICLYVLFPQPVVAWGHSLAFRKSVFDSVSDYAWKVLNRFIVDDQAIPRIFDSIGYAISFRNIYCPVQWSGKTVGEVFKQKNFWTLYQKAGVGNAVVYLTAMLFYPMVPALLLLLASGFHPVAWMVFFLTPLVRIGICFVHEKLFLGSISQTLRWFWTIPVWDLLQLYFIPKGFSRKHISYFGKTYKIVGRFFLEEVPNGQK